MTYLTYDEIFDALFGENVSQQDKDNAKANVTNLSDDEWNGWIEYKNSKRIVTYRDPLSCEPANPYNWVNGYKVQR